MYKLLYILPSNGVAATVTISYPVFPLIPPYSVSESPNPLFSLDPVAGFEPEGRGFESLPAYHMNQVPTRALNSRRQVGSPSGVSHDQRPLA